MDLGLKDKVAVITGGSIGIGLAIAEGLAQEGVHLLLCARDAERLRDRARELAARYGIRAIGVAADVSRAEDIARVVAAAGAELGGADILVNNAGTAKVGPAAAESLADFRAVMDVNLTGAFLCAQRFGRVMLQQKQGSIVNIASILGLVASGLVPQASYTASKGALVNLTRELGAQWARLGVRVNAIAPGFFPSEMTTDLFETEEGVRFIRRRTPMGRPGRPEELLGALLLLASDASSYMTGQIVTVDGGWTIV
jgi:NAD(P)-dependent dehydrogenase (short-subunit alcohol dehydrogenase family)